MAPLNANLAACSIVAGTISPMLPAPLLYIKQPSLLQAFQTVAQASAASFVLMGVLYVPRRTVHCWAHWYCMCIKMWIMHEENNMQFHANTEGCSRQTASVFSYFYFRYILT